MVEVYLAHHGIKGQKWGVRRFQNYDGTRTAAGKKRYALSEDSLNKSKDVINASREAVNAAQQAVRTASKVRSRKASDPDEDLSRMTDEELRKKINRMNLERQYRDLSKKDISKGRQYLDDALSIAGTTLAIAGSALSIALAIKKLKEG